MGILNVTVTLEDSLAISYQTKHTLSIWSSNQTPWYLLKEFENWCPHKTCTWMFITALFIIVKAWKQPKCPSVGEWINKLWHIQRMEYYPELKRNELYWAMKIHGKTLSAYYWVIEANLKRQHTGWFQLYDTLEKEKLWRQ